MTDTKEIQARLDDAKNRAWHNRRKMYLSNCVVKLNELFGSSDTIVSADLWRAVSDFTELYGITVSFNTTMLTNQCRPIFTGNLWRELCAEDVKLIGTIISNVLHPVIKYDPASMRFYADGTDSPSEVYKKECVEWSKLSWVTRLWRNKPVMVYAQHLDASQATGDIS